MKIKICGLFREQDIAYANEALPDFAGFVFAPSKRQVSPSSAAALRRRLSDGITPAGVFVNAPITEIVSLYNDNVISIAQLHGDEDEAYIAALKEKQIPIIKTIRINHEPHKRHEPLLSNLSGVRVGLCGSWSNIIDYFLLDSDAGSGKPFNWEILKQADFGLPWFLAGGINLDNIEQAMALKPFAIDVSSGAETGGIKDREKMIQLVKKAHNE